jgi:hypothetical protein
VLRLRGKNDLCVHVAVNGLNCDFVAVAVKANDHVNVNITTTTAVGWLKPSSLSWRLGG